MRVIEEWRRVWRDGLAPQISAPGLEVLRKALLTDDPRLMQGYTVFPFVFASTGGHSVPVRGACALSYCGWQSGVFVDTADDIMDYFIRLCAECDRILGFENSSDWFVDFFDDTPREEMRRQLLAEVNRTLAMRSGETLPDSLLIEVPDSTEPVLV